MKAISEMKCDTEQTMKLEQLYKVVSEYELTHGLIAQSVRASEQDSVDVAQIPLRPTFYSYFKKSASGEYHIYKYIGHKCIFYNEAIGGLAITGKSHCLHITICIYIYILYIYIYILYIYIYIYLYINKYIDATLYLSQNAKAEVFKQRSNTKGVPLEN